MDFDASDRPLAYLEVIRNLEPIPKADAIEVATILGWKVVVKKGLHKIGEKIVYFEIDSILPAVPTFAELEKVKYIIRTIKLRGQVSQGYCAPLICIDSCTFNKYSAIKNTASDDGSLLLHNNESNENQPLEVGTNLTELLGVKKRVVGGTIWQTRHTVDKSIKGRFPEFLRKTDQARIQNKPDMPTYFPDVEFEVTEKLEGTSITAFWLDDQFGVCSRNLQLKVEGEDLSTPVQALISMGIREKLVNAKLCIALQGELIGPGIQANYYNIPDLRYRIFDVFLIKEQRYALPRERMEILAQLELSDFSVPVLEFKTLRGQSVESLLKYAEGQSVIQKGVIREGVVFKSTELYRGEVVHFKAVSNHYLLKTNS
eukprot:TRINITY_DN2316_c0_g1_i3.p1 TRINITY_DN2316_c0_g1~~TRINITY_DN2316_c0_g1_i3.p1  ORF type:complete len:372 (+),score=84.65 TRINITY_DN2316_c0_g1_i3:84-1199(+)